MATFAETLYTFLSTSASLAGVLIYPVQLPQNVVLPALAYTAIGGTREYSHDGDADLAYPRWQTSAWANTYFAAHVLAQKVITAMKAWPGSAECSGPTDVLIPDARLFCVLVDMNFVYEE